LGSGLYNRVVEVMRSRERLIEVLLSIPGGNIDRILLRTAGRTMWVKGDRASFSAAFIARLRQIARNQESPHYRKLASEALHYLKGSK